MTTSTEDAGRRRFVEARMGAVERVWAPRAVQVEDGAAGGRRRIELRHLGGLDVAVEVDQFLDLGEASWRGDAVSFVAPSTSLRAEGWGRRWQGGLLTTCGLTAVGRATPEEGGMHGRAHLVPATVTRREGRWRDGRYELIVSGLLREGAIFEENLTVERTIRAEIGSSTIRLTDVIRNEGFTDAAVRVLYHINLGWPLLHEGAVVRAEATAPGEARDAGQGGASGEVGAAWERRIEAPAPATPERVDALIAVGPSGGWSTASLTGASGVATVRFRPEQLPYLTVWRSAAAGSYALGIEPGTCWPSHAEGPDEGKTGRVLAPGETTTVELEIGFADQG
jgi:hypothetical protein